MTHIKISMSVVDGLRTSLCGTNAMEVKDHEFRHVPSCDEWCEALEVDCPECIVAYRLLQAAKIRINSHHTKGA